MFSKCVKQNNHACFLVYHNVLVLSKQLITHPQCPESKIHWNNFLTGLTFLTPSLSHTPEGEGRVREKFMIQVL